MSWKQGTAPDQDLERRSRLWLLGTQEREGSHFAIGPGDGLEGFVLGSLELR